MRKFVSNDSEVMESIAEEDRLPKKMVEFQENDHGFTKALGLGWHISTDEFSIQISDTLKTPLDKVTKRTILSKVSKIYDIFPSAFE